MTGNVTPGGVHEARLATTGVGPPTRAGRSVRLPGSGEKNRERSERMKASGQASGARSFARASVARKSAARRPTRATNTACLHLRIASRSTAAPDGGAGPGPIEEPSSIGFGSAQRAQGGAAKRASRS
eukprot:4962907-Pleurochrysis_carterae.AAC.1